MQQEVDLVNETTVGVDRPRFYSDPKLEYLLDLVDETEYVCYGVVVTRGEFLQPSKYTPSTAAAMLEEYRCELLEDNPDLFDTICVIPTKIDTSIYDEPERFKPRPSRISKLAFCNSDLITNPISRKLVLSHETPSCSIQETPAYFSMPSLQTATARKPDFQPPRFAKSPLVQGCNQLLKNVPNLPSIQSNQISLGNSKLQQVIFINVIIYTGQIDAAVSLHLPNSQSFSHYHWICCFPNQSFLPQDIPFPLLWWVLLVSPHLSSTLLATFHITFISIPQYIHSFILSLHFI